MVPRWMATAPHIVRHSFTTEKEGFTAMSDKTKQQAYGSDQSGQSSSQAGKSPVISIRSSSQQGGRAFSDIPQPRTDFQGLMGQVAAVSDTGEQIELMVWESQQALEAAQQADRTLGASPAYRPTHASGQLSDLFGGSSSPQSSRSSSQSGSKPNA